jgi:DNA-binding phage protein
MTVAGEKLYNKILQLEQNKKEGQKIIATRSGLSRTNGRILVSNTAKPALQTGLFGDVDLYEMEFNSSYGRFGFMNNGRLQTFTSDSDSSRASIYDYALSQSTSAVNGTLMYLKPVYRKELRNSESIPVALDRHKLEDGDIEFIISVLRNIKNIDQPARISIDG